MKTLEMEIQTGVMVIPYTKDGKIYLIRSDSRENGSKAEFVLNEATGEMIGYPDPCPGHADFQFPGGGMEEGETSAATASREFNEEVLGGLLFPDQDNPFLELYGVLEDIGGLLVQQFFVNQYTGAYTLRAVFRIKAMLICLTDTQEQYLLENGLVTSYADVFSSNSVLRPYVRTLFERGIINQLVGTVN